MHCLGLHAVSSRPLNAELAVDAVSSRLLHAELVMVSDRG